jgi:hypothetical protein
MYFSLNVTSNNEIHIGNTWLNMIISSKTSHNIFAMLNLSQTPWIHFPFFDTEKLFWCDAKAFSTQNTCVNHSFFFLGYMILNKKPFFTIPTANREKNVLFLYIQSSHLSLATFTALQSFCNTFASCLLLFFCLLQKACLCWYEKRKKSIKRF